MPTSEIVNINDKQRAHNPPTQEKQDEIITAIQNITIDPPVGGATESTLAIVASSIHDEDSLHVS